MKLRQRIPVCEHGNEDSITIDLVLALDRLERYLGYELIYNSGFRCPECNEKAGGSKNSAHLRGAVVDISVVTSAQRYNIVRLAFVCGFRRIGIGKNFVHLDVDLSLTQDVLWLY